MRFQTFVFVVFLMTVLLVPAGQAQSRTQPDPEPDNQGTSEEEPEEDPVTPDPLEYEVTVTATRASISVDKVGFTTHVIGREEIEAQGARTIAQVLETVPGFSVVRTGSFGGQTSVFVRGGESDFNLVLVDGVQINQPGGTMDFADLTTANVERIEIVRGPGSVLYGSEAVTSIIHIITTQGQGRPGADFQMEGGTFNSYLFSGSASGGTERVGYALSGLVSDTSGFLPFNSDYQRGELSARFDFQPWSSTAITATVRHRNSEQEFATDSSGAAVDPNDFRTTEDTLYTVRFSQIVTSSYTSSVQYGFHRRNSENLTIFDGVTDFFDFTLVREDSRSYLDWQNDFVVGDSHRLTTGLSYDREESITESAARRSLGVYIQDQMSLGSRLSLTTGFRFDDNDRFKDFVSANFSASFKLSPYARLRSSIGNGFRSPTFDEILGFPNFGILGNPDLRPEQNLGMDAGIDLRLPRRSAGLSATFFWNRFTDLIEFTFAVPPGSPNTLNIEEARSQGLEIDGFREVRPGLRLGGAYTLTATEVTDSGSTPGGNFVEGESLLRRPRHSGLVYVSYSARRLTGRVDFKYKGQRDDRQFFPDFSSARVQLPGYLKVDFGLRFSLFYWGSDGDVAFTLRGENLFDHEYKEIAGFASPGRQIMAGLGFRF